LLLIWKQTTSNRQIVEVVLVVLVKKIRPLVNHGAAEGISFWFWVSDLSSSSLSWGSDSRSFFCAMLEFITYETYDLLCLSIGLVPFILYICNNIISYM
jgi:hypothetical protein